MTDSRPTPPPPSPPAARPALWFVLCLGALGPLLGTGLGACTASGSTPVGLTGAPCTGRADCDGETCLPVGGADRVCTTACRVDDECLPGWTCGGFGGVSGAVCLCEAQPEACDGEDDDCDGLIDEQCGAVSCGDGVCDGEEAEDCGTCAEDCGACAPARCGDGVCGAGESCSGCAPDCGACEATCGDGTCDVDDGESCDTCADDCGACGPTCGDGTCEGGESCSTCADDCGACCADTADEPNDTKVEATRYTRPAPYTCAYTDTFEGVLAGDTDDDWFALTSIDTRAGGCSHRMTVDAPGLRSCIYGACAISDSRPTTTCTSGSFAVSPDGVPGCCSDDGRATMEIVCRPGASQATTYYFHVSGADGPMCQPYRVTYGGSAG